MRTRFFALPAGSLSYDLTRAIFYAAVVLACIVPVVATAGDSDWEPEYGLWGVSDLYLPLMGYYERNSGAHAGGTLHFFIGDTANIWWYRWVYNTETQESLDAETITYYRPQASSPPSIRSTLQPAVWTQAANFSGIPGVEDPPDPNPYFGGTIIITSGSVAVPPTIPHGPTTTSVQVSWSVGPQGILFDDRLAWPIVVELWDPLNPWHCYYRWLTGTSGNFAWSGDLYTWDYEYWIPNGGPFYTPASTVFARIYIAVRDRIYDGDTLVSDYHTIGYEMPGLAVWLVQPPDEGAATTEPQAGVNFRVCRTTQNFAATSLTIQIDKAFRPKAGLPGTLPYVAANLLHSVGATYTTSSANQFPICVYETGSRVDGVSQTNLGPRSIRLRARNAAGTILTTSYTVELVRDARLTAYYTPWEVNPSFSDDFVTSRATVTSGSAHVGLYFDTTFLQRVIVEGSGRVHRLRTSSNDRLNSGTVPGANQQYLGVYGGWHFQAAPATASGTAVTINSTARQWQGYPRRSYYNGAAYGGDYRIPGLEQHVGVRIDNLSTSAALNQDLSQDPPDRRITDDTGEPDPDDAFWMDIYYMPMPGSTRGVDPEMINKLSVVYWNLIDPNAPHEKPRVYRNAGQ